MNIGEIKLNAIKMAELPGKTSGRNAIEYFHSEVRKSYIKRTQYDRTRESSAKWQERYLSLNKYISSVKKRLLILGFDVRKVFVREKKNE